MNNSRVVDLMKQRELALAQEATSRRRRQRFHADPNCPHTLEKERSLKFGGHVGMMGGNMVGAGAVVLFPRAWGVFKKLSETLADRGQKKPN